MSDRVVDGEIGPLDLGHGEFQRAFCGDALDDPLSAGLRTLVIERRLRGWRRFCAWYWHRPTVYRYEINDVTIDGMRVTGPDHVEVTFTARDGHVGSIQMPR